MKIAMTRPTPQPARAQILQRTVRFCINPDHSTLGENTFAGKPSMTGLGRYDEITLAIQGQPDPHTGYLIGIQEIDAIVRDHLIPIIARQTETDPRVHPATLLSTFWKIASDQINHTLCAIRWQLTPYHTIEMTDITHPTNPTSAVLIRQRFEFAAAHRLHTPTMSDAENKAYFGKCNNPSGHGHNYQLEPAVRIPVALLESRDYQLDIERAVNSTLLDHLDHKFLNIDCPWFDQTQGGVIPSIENIARVCYQQLAPEIAQIAPGIELVSMTAWETQKTSSIYPADAH